MTKSAIARVFLRQLRVASFHFCAAVFFLSLFSSLTSSPLFLLSLFLSPQQQADADVIVTFLSDEAAVKQLRSADKAANLQHLRETAGIGAAHVDALFSYAKFQFECGNYGAAAELLYHYSNLGTDAAKVLSSLWGRLAAQILTQSWDAALESLHRLRDAVDSEGLHAPPAEQVQRRAWLLHWALFVHFNHEAGRSGLVDLFFTDRYLNAAQTVAPHLLRYAAVAAVVNFRRRGRGALRDLARVVEQEAYEYSDPITEFVRRLFTLADFEGAREALAEARSVMEGDFFVAALAGEFADAARLLVFEAYCRVHERVDLGLLSEKLGLDVTGGEAGSAGEASTSGGDGDKKDENASADAAEAWIVDLIRTARLRARVDSRARAVVIASAFPSVQDQLIETVKGLTQRTQVLANAVGAGTPRP